MAEEVAMTDPCRTPWCQFFQYCPLRPRPPAPGEPPKHQTINRNFTDTTACRFEVKDGIGRLRIKGLLDDHMNHILGEAEQALPTLAGLFVTFNSGGGNHFSGLQLEKLILATKQSAPVVAFVEKALSAALIPCVAAHATYASTDAQIGGCGGILPFCDGCRPRILVSTQTPQKHSGAIPPPRILTDSDWSHYQQFLDVGYEEAFEVIARYVQCDRDELRYYLDGRVMNADEALRGGFLTGITDEFSAFGHLLKMAGEWQ